MEILYFIAGILSVGIVYGITLLRSVKSSHTEMLARHQSQSNISSIRNADLDDQLDSLKLLISDIQSNMEKDQYESLSEINGKLRDGILLAEANNRKIADNAKVFNKNVTDAFTQIQQLRNNIKALGQDQQGVSRY
tara:strand:+ start:459 stop:866 length:408 start_codon:yes stop_codon:yes gene_type:complete